MRNGIFDRKSCLILTELYCGMIAYLSPFFVANVSGSTYTLHKVKLPICDPFGFQITDVSPVPFPPFRELVC